MIPFSYHIYYFVKKQLTFLYDAISQTLLIYSFGF